MSLLDSAYEPFVFVSKSFTPDGEGGMIPTWTDGTDTFQATADFPNSSLAKIADKLTEKVNCTITTPKTITLSYMDIIKRVSDGTYFRILSDGKNSKTPDSASLDMRQSKAEIWTKPSSGT